MHCLLKVQKMCYKRPSTYIHTVRYKSRSGVCVCVRTCTHAHTAAFSLKKPEEFKQIKMHAYFRWIIEKSQYLSSEALCTTLYTICISVFVSLHQIAHKLRVSGAGQRCRSCRMCVLDAGVGGTQLPLCVGLALRPGAAPAPGMPAAPVSPPRSLDPTAPRPRT